MSGSFLHSLLSYGSFLVRSRSRHAVHSPFVFELIEKVLARNEQPAVFFEIRKIKEELARSSRVLETTDFGVGADFHSYSTKFLTVREIAGKSSVRRETGEMLYRLVDHFKPANILELGTSFGISTSYLAAAHRGARVVTMEGCAAKVDIARENFVKLDLRNIEVSTGRFDSSLPKVLGSMPLIDMIFIDGHHQYKPTISYLRSILQHINRDTLLVMDDIHWSAGMEKAWEEVTGLQDVTVSIDLFHSGLVFFKEGLTKQHFILRY